MTPIETPRLTLREMTAEDAPYVLDALNQPSFVRFIGDRGVRDLDGARRYLSERVIAQYERHGFGMWLMQRREDGQPVGMCGLVRREVLDDVDIGYAVLERHWGRGYGSEAAAAVLDHALRVLGLPRVVAITAPDNAASMAVLRGLGMRMVDVRQVGEWTSAFFTTDPA